MGLIQLSLAPFQGELRETLSPGLKPRAESSCPFGVENPFRNFKLMLMGSRRIAAKLWARRASSTTGGRAVATLWRALAASLKNTIELAAIRPPPDELGFSPCYESWISPAHTFLIGDEFLGSQ